MRVERHVSIDAPADDVWRRVGDPARYPRFMPDVTRCEPVEAGDHDHDHDDRPRFRITVRVGAVELGSTIAVTASRPGRELRWESVAGVRQRGAWHLAEHPDGTTTVTLTVEYHAPHGLLGAFADPAAVPLLHRSTGAWLTRLKADVEGRARPSAMTAAVTAAGEAAYDATVLSRAGLVVPSRPTRLLRAGLTLARRRISPATGYAVAAALHPGDAAVVDERGTLTFAELDRSADALARRLAEAGVGPGGALAVLCRNHRGFVQATLAASRLGADALLLNTGLAGPQLGEILARERPAGVVHDDEFTDAVAALPGGAPRIVAWCDGAPPAGRPTIDELTAGADEGRVPAPRRRGRVVLLTSGTTGAPRGAARQEPGSLTAAAALLGRIPLRARERTLVASPLFHSWGYTHLALASVLSSTLVLRRHFDAEATLALVERHRIDALVVVPTMLQRLLALPAGVRRRYDTASLRVVATSGAALPGPLATRFMDEFGDVLYNLYGSTEVAWAAIATPHDLR
ncbi:MAG TPA: AMP-binding protein, partial [Solirubrobacteraceae bacterium]|nr:AMP-binding protein [Solirubrobacteraceae bacterium]